ncbi:MAG: response regulator transcription factor [Myxococcales bacterium]|jgi:two-component system response regulator NreC|nr:response regulator transcription factor [Myxococcales bacterium]MBK7198812.1 response regulator transcription factor [Myxococcales bacterium]MBP6846509.1 response regulator transcription factor [Kofleriaceae bacterium]
MIRVVIAEDHTLIREALAKMLIASHRIDVVGQAATGTEAVSQVSRLHPDVLLLDVSMPEKDGIAALADLAALETGTKTIILTMHEDEAHGVRAIRGGAAGYVKKSANLDELLAAIERVHRGERVIPEEVEAALGKKRSDHPAQVLSSREFQVMEYLAAGKTNREIAEMLAISVKTVDTHRGHVLKKLRLRNNSDITRFAIQHGLMPV